MRGDEKVDVDFGVNFGVKFGPQRGDSEDVVGRVGRQGWCVSVCSQGGSGGWALQATLEMVARRGATLKTS